MDHRAAYGVIADSYDVLIEIAPAPVLAWRQGLHDWVAGSAEVPGRVLLRRCIAAADVTAREAEAQMNPCTPLAQTRVAPGALRHDRKELRHVLARERCGRSAEINGSSVDRNCRDGGARQSQNGGEQSDGVEGVDEGGARRPGRAPAPAAPL